MCDRSGTETLLIHSAHTLSLLILKRLLEERQLLWCLPEIHSTANFNGLWMLLIFPSSLFSLSHYIFLPSNEVYLSSTSLPPFAQFHYAILLFRPRRCCLLSFIIISQTIAIMFAYFDYIYRKKFGTTQGKNGSSMFILKAKLLNPFPLSHLCEFISPSFNKFRWLSISPGTLCACLVSPKYEHSRPFCHFFSGQFTIYRKLPLIHYLRSWRDKN